MKNVSEFEGSLWRDSRIIRPIYERHFRDINTTLEMRATLRAGSTTDLGGYPLFLLTSDGECLCFDCGRSEYRQISESIRAKSSNGWRVVGCDINYEDSDMMCAHCNRDIAPAYVGDTDTNGDSDNGT